MTLVPRAGRLAAALLVIAVPAAAQSTPAQPASGWTLYRATIAAASGALRLYETSDAKRWLAEAPAAHRGWEWRYLDGVADESLAERQAHDAAITGLAASPDGRLLATTSADKSVKLWDAQTGAPVATLAGHTAASWSPAFRAYQKLGNGMGAVAWSPDGRLLATGGAGRTITLWDMPSGKPVRTLEGHTELVYGIDFSPDGARLASASNDQTVRLWEPVSGAHLLTIPYAVQVYGVRFSPDGRVLATLPMDGTIRLLGAR